ncbi:hypothetical protein KR054_000409 [Drosophila jambulina]|nr:hypothetical protein KR054_000409 [Drosophila jambulina]
MPDNFRRNLCRVRSPSTEKSNILTSTNLGKFLPAPKKRIRPKLSVSRHVTFTPSTLDHQEYRRRVRQAVPSAFQNFVREMVAGYFELKLMEERRKYGLAPDHPLGGRRLPIKDLVHLQIVARDMWRKMKAEGKQRYKQLAKEAARRKKQRLPPDPYRIPPRTKKVGKTFQILKSQIEC